jgi:BR serine/threonine kinase
MTAPRQIGSYSLLRTISSSSTGKIKLAEHATNGRKVAVKIIKRSLLTERPELAARVHREISFMRLFENPHLLRLIEVCESGSHLYIIREYAENGNLFDFIKAHESCQVSEGLKLFRDLIYAIEYLHSYGICHRDLKPENIFLDDNNTLKVAHFGMAKFVETGIRESNCASPHYAAPEIISGESYDGRKSDIWSAGVILFAILSGRLPFDDSSIRGVLQKVKSGTYRMPDFPGEVKDLITRILEVNPLNRISIPLIKAHRAFRMDLPPNYNCPAPLPFPIAIEPVQIETIDANLLETLHNIGYDQNEKLFADLRSTETTRAKVFYLALSNQMSMSMLPWQQDPDLIGDGFDDDFMFKPEAYDSYGEGSGEKIFSASATGDSLIERTLFSDEGPSYACNCTTEFEVGVSLQSLVVALHDYLGRRRFAWFYPNQWRILARRDAMDVMDVIFEIAPDLASLKLLVSLVQGPANDYGALLVEVREVIAGIVPN